MLRKNFLIMSLKTVPALFAMVFFLGSVLIMPTWAMKHDEDQEKSSQSIVRIQNKAELDKYLKDDESRWICRICEVRPKKDEKMVISRYTTPLERQNS